MAHGKDIDAADWVDQDLLTKEESRDRLDEEIEFERKKLKELESAAGNQASLDLTKRRLVAMENLRASL
ncbi:hypothetical protein [Gordonia hydrophobica]|uniref:Uncharacterized protein n=1 Tax=Gordonia hydrophobica TaxID=40516 RepID=A0ABZ2TZE5_9ACTN|nr:hypothetical protein [Gordonia hydrophobica]MBM7368828.1 hypothetical protein [Gordonia hydrophobica]